MVKNPVDMNLVFKRNSCMADSREHDESWYHRYLYADRMISEGKDIYTIKESVNNMLKSYSSKANAKDGFVRCFNIMESLYENGYNDILFDSVHFFIESILPYCEDLTSVKERAASMNLEQVNIDKIVESASQYISCDYMIKNHDKLIKRFTTDSILPAGIHTPLNEICRSICEMIDTYDIKPKIKMKLCLEEILYFTDKNGIHCNEQAMVESVTDYFLSLANTEDTINDYRKVIKESKLLSLNADKRVKFLTEQKSLSSADNTNHVASTLYELNLILEDYGTDKVKELIDNYKLEAEKNDTKFHNVLRKIFTQSPKNIIEDTPDILKWVRNFAVLVVGAQNIPAAIVAFLLNGYMHFDMRKTETERVIKYFENERDSIESQIARTSNDEKLKRLNSYSEELEKAIEKLHKYNDSLYTQDELMNKMDDDIDLEESYTIEDTHKVIMGNLIADAMKADETIEKLIDAEGLPITQQSELKDTVTKENAVNYVDPEGRISFVLHSYNTTAYPNKTRLYEFVDSVVRTVNNMLSNTKGKVYYTMMEGNIDFVFRSKFKVITTLKEDEQISTYITDVEAMRASFVIESAALLEEFANMEPYNLVDKAIKKIGLISYDNARMFIEAWGYGVPIDKDEMQRFVNEYYDYQIETEEYVDAYNIKSLFESEANNVTNTTSLKDIVEATTIMQDIVTEGADLNSLKLAWMSFKKKMKGLSAKEQEASRDLDAGFNNLIRSMKSFYTVTDHREELIRGQVCPSLSKIVKIGISLAILGVASGGVIIPAIAAVTGMAISKNANDKERKFIIDEYDIELKIVDRELKRIEDSGKSSPKKYRQLLAYQKNLQRGKQQIIYHLSSKGKGIPLPSTAGIKGKDDD